MTTMYVQTKSGELREGGYVLVCTRSLRDQIWIKCQLGAARKDKLPIRMMNVLCPLFSVCLLPLQPRLCQPVKVFRLIGALLAKTLMWGDVHAFDQKDLHLQGLNLSL